MANEAEFTIEELVKTTGVAARTIRSWTRIGLLQAVEFRGPATTYSAEHLARLRVVHLLRSRKMKLRAIKKQLASATPADIERLLAPPPQPLELRQPPPEPHYPADRWERIVLAPGLEVHVRADAGALLRRIAEDIYHHYGM